ncbi:hypothetical protein DFH09DRAFT_1318715 [Mycena vulgaris]|nr:hypothetical protein DFH09DRAFT_1318715 [Mycena vulgaris]
MCLTLQNATFLRLVAAHIPHLKYLALYPSTTPHASGMEYAIEQSLALFKGLHALKFPDFTPAGDEELTR